MVLLKQIFILCQDNFSFVWKGLSYGKIIKFLRVSFSKKSNNGRVCGGFVRWVRLKMLLVND